MVWRLRERGRGRSSSESSKTAAEPKKNIEKGKFPSSRKLLGSFMATQNTVWGMKQLKLPGLVVVLMRAAFIALCFRKSQGYHSEAIQHFRIRW